MKRDLYTRPDETRTADGGRPGQYPRFHLKPLPDNVDDPQEITLVPKRPVDISAEWITADVDTAIPVGECR